MVLGLHLLGCDDALYDAVLVDDEGGAEGAEIFAAIHTLLSPGAEGLVEGQVGVGYQVEGQLVLLDKFVVRLAVLHTYAEHVKTGGLQLAVVVAQVAGLSRASGSHVLGVEIEHQFLPFVITQADLLPVLVLAQYLGGFVSYVHDTVFESFRWRS